MPRPRRHCVGAPCPNTTSASSNSRGANDHIIANKQEVALQLMLLELPPFETKEQNVVLLLPQVTQAMVSCGTSMNECEAKVIGMCSGLSYPTADCISICLFQWDPGERTRTSRNLVVSRDIAMNACAKELTEDSSDRSDHYEKPGENAISKCFLKGICVELLPYQFNCVGPSCQQSMEDHVACAPVPINCTTGGLGHSADGGDSVKPCLAAWSTCMLVSSSAVSATAQVVCGVLPINGNINITKELAEATGNPCLIRDSLLMNSWLNFCLVKLLFQDDYAHEAHSDCHIIETGCMMFAPHNENDVESECKTLIRCCLNIRDVDLVARVLFPSLEFAVKLANLHEKLQRYFIILVDLKPWPSWELDAGVIGIVDITKLDAAVSCKAFKAKVPSVIDTNSSGIGDERRPPWPPLELVNMHIFGIQYMQSTNIHFEAPPYPAQLVIGIPKNVLATCSVMRSLPIGYASSSLTAKFLERNQVSQCSCEGILGQYPCCKVILLANAAWHGSAPFPWYITGFLVELCCARTELGESMCERTLIWEAQMMHDLLVELVRFKHWPFWQLHKLISTMACPCDISVCTTYGKYVQKWWSSIQHAQQAIAIPAVFLGQVCYIFGVSATGLVQYVSASGFVTTADWAHLQEGGTSKAETIAFLEMLLPGRTMEQNFSSYSSPAGSGVWESSPWDPGQWAVNVREFQCSSASNSGVFTLVGRATENSSYNTVKDNQTPLFGWDIAWVFYLEYPDSDRDKFRRQLCPESIDGLVVNALKSTQTNIHIFCSTMKRVVKLVRQPLPLPKPDASILLLEGLPRSSVHLSLEVSDAKPVDSGLMYLMDDIQSSPENLSATPFSWSEKLQLEIAWSIDLAYSAIANKARQPFFAVSLSHYIPHGIHMYLSLKYCTRICYLEIEIRSSAVCSSTTANIQGCNCSGSLLFSCKNLHLSWNHLHANQDYCLNAFVNRILISHEDDYNDLVQVHLDQGFTIGYSYHHVIDELKKYHVPWDSGGSPWCRLGVKPKIKEGGMLATPSSATGLDSGPPVLGLGFSKTTRDMY